MELIAVLAAVLLAVTAQVVTGTGSGASRAVFGALELLAGLWAATAALGAARRLPRRADLVVLRRAWGLLAVSFTAWSTGQAIFAAQDVLGLSVPATNWSDAPFALHTVLLIVAALLQVISLSRRHVGWRTAADGTLLALSVLALNWAGWLGPTIRDYPGDRLDLLVPLAYPVADLLSLTLLVSALTLAGWSRAGVLLLTGGVLMTAAVSLYTYALITDGRFATGGLPDVGWVLAFSLFALAARHSGQRRTSPAARGAHALVLYLPYVFAVPAVTVAGVQLLREPDPVQVVLMLALFAVTLTRQLAVLIDHRKLLALTEQQRAELDHLAHIDPLTGLQNRRRFTAHLHTAVRQALQVTSAESTGPGRGAGSSRVGPAQVTVAFIDLDHFKTINDTLGHATGDQLLTTVAERLRSCLRPQDHCARWGGDEFACLSTGMDPATLQARFHDVMAQPVTVNGHTVTAGASIGAVTLTDVTRLLPPRPPAPSAPTTSAPVRPVVAGDTDLDAHVGRLVEDLLSHADERMYLIKADRRGSRAAPTSAQGPPGTVVHRST